MKELILKIKENNSAWRSKFLLSPESPPRFLWEIFVALTLLFFGFATPYLEAFDKNNTELENIEDFISVTVFSLDIILNFNTAYYEKGEVIRDRKKIIQNYLEFWFWFDLITTLPYNWMFNKIQNESLNIFVVMLKLLKLLRLVRLRLVLYRIEDHIYNEKFIYIMMIFKLIIYLFLIAHFLACLMFIVSTSELNPNSIVALIINKSAEKDDHIIDLYISSLYWAVMTMTSVGFGDIAPVTTKERLVGIFTMFFSSITFGIIIGNIGNIMDKYTKQYNARQEAIVNTNTFMKQNNLNDELRQKARMYIDYIFHNDKYSDDLISQIFLTLSNSLQEEILLCTNGNIISSCKTFTVLPQFISNKVAGFLTVKIFLPKDQIIYESQTPEGMYFLLNGKVNVVDLSSHKRIVILSAPSFFGEIGLFTSQPCVSSIFSGDYCETLFLSVFVFDETINSYLNVKSSLEDLRKSCSDGNYSSLHISCYSCLGLGHIAKNCQAIVNDEIIKKKWIDKRNKSTYVNPYDNHGKKLKFIRNIRKVKVKEVAARNVIGKKRKVREQFPKHGMVKHIKRYFQNNIKSEENVMYTEESGIDTVSIIDNSELYLKVLSSSEENLDE